MNKVDELAEKLRQLLIKGEYRIGMRFPSEYEWMNRYQVSRLTANKAMSLLTAEGLLRRGKRGEGTFVQNTKIFPSGYFFLFCDIRSPYVAEVANGLIQCAYEQNYQINIFNPFQEQMSNCLEQLKTSDYLGGFSLLYGIHPINFPKKIIYLDSGIPTEDVYRHSICCAGYDAARKMVTEVLKAGYHDIVVAANESTLSCHQRAQGFLDVLKESGYKDAQKRFFHVQYFTEYDAEQCFQQICTRFPKREIILTNTDDLAFLLLKVFHKHHIAFPKEIGITGFGNVRGVSNLYKIPTVDQHPWHIGASAFSAMLEILRDGEPERPLRIETPCELVNMEYLCSTHHRS